MNKIHENPNISRKIIIFFTVKPTKFHAILPEYSVEIRRNIKDFVESSKFPCISIWNLQSFHAFLQNEGSYRFLWKYVNAVIFPSFLYNSFVIGMMENNSEYSVELCIELFANI